MKVWVLEHRSAWHVGCWTGDGLAFTTDLNAAVQFVRQADAEKVLAGMPLMDARPVEKELPDRDEPGAQSAAIHRGDGGAVDAKT